MNEKKLTKRDCFNSLLELSEVKSNPTLTDFINHELELLSRKNSSEKKPTATQEANKAIALEIWEAMEPNRLYTITELIKENPRYSDFTTSKMSAIVRVNLVQTGMVERIEDKRKAYFSKVE